MILKIILDSPVEPSVITRVIIRETREPESERELNKLHCRFPKWKMRTRSREMQIALEDGKGKEMIISESLLKELSHVNTLILAA